MLGGGSPNVKRRRQTYKTIMGKLLGASYVDEQQTYKVTIGKILGISYALQGSKMFLTFLVYKHALMLRPVKFASRECGASS
jgi:hypothetical protein